MYRLRRLIHGLMGRLAVSPTRMSRHDLILAVIPTLFLLAGLIGATLNVNTTAAVGAAAAFSTLAVLDALFLNPPRRPSAGGRSA